MKTNEILHSVIHLIFIFKHNYYLAFIILQLAEQNLIKELL